MKAAFCPQTGAFLLPMLLPALYSAAALSQPDPSVGSINAIPFQQLLPDPEEERRRPPFISALSGMKNTPLTGEKPFIEPFFPAVIPDELRSLAADSEPFAGDIPLELEEELQAREALFEQAHSVQGTDRLAAFIASEPDQNPDIKAAAEFLDKTLKSDDMEIFRSFAGCALERCSLAQILSLLHKDLDNRGNTALHYMAQSPSKETADEIRFLLAAFLPVEEALRETPLREIRKAFAPDSDSEDAAPQASLWDQALKEQLEWRGELSDGKGGLSIEKSGFAEAWRRGDKEAFQNTLEREIFMPENAAIALSLLLGKTAEKLSVFDFAAAFDKPLREDLEKELALVRRWIALPLRAKNRAGRTPLDLAKKTFENKGHPGAFAALYNAERALRISPPPPAGGRLKRGLKGGALAAALAGAAAAGAGAAACFASFSSF